MSKAHESNKEPKKPPSLNLKEKRAARKAKKNLEEVRPFLPPPESPGHAGKEKPSNRQ
ncbi:hypothetical protein [Niveibacterium sp. SC-1]|uniref:hypothetical protein n=1 Tax=Niveibacterium sp. SC-1 TaxID=3135646 RepID=UPI00311E6977